MIINEELNSTQVGTLVFDFLFLSLHPSLTIPVYTNSFILFSLSSSIHIYSSCAAVNLHSTFHHKPSQNNLFYKTQLKKSKDYNFQFVKQVQNYNFCLKFHFRTVQYCL